MYREILGIVEDPESRLKLRPSVQDIAEREERKPKHGVEKGAKDLVLGDAWDPSELLQLALAKVKQASP